MRLLRLWGLALVLAGIAGAGILWRWPLLAQPGLYRDRIAAFAGAELGREVRIGGQIRLGLATGPVLIARDVAIADRGDGISARVHALRLRLDFTDLLGLRLVPRSLVLDRPELVLPWPLPAPGRADLPPGFSARLEDAAIVLGGQHFTAVNGTLSRDADSGAFTAAGTAMLAGQRFRFNFVLGAPDAKGAANLALTLDAAGENTGTGGSLRGRLLADSGLSGSLNVRGQHLAHFLAAPDLPFSAQGNFSVVAGNFAAPDLQLVLGGSAGAARLQLRLLPPLRLDAGLELGQLSAGPWLAGLAAESLPLSTHLSLRAKALHWDGLELRDAAISMAHDPSAGAAAEWVIEQAGATLPGGAQARLHGTLARGQSRFTGEAEVNAADARAVMPGFAGAARDWLGESSRAVSLRTEIELTDQALSLRNLRAALAAGTEPTATAAALTGSLHYGWGTAPGLSAALVLDGVTLPDRLPGLGGLAPPGGPVSLSLHLPHAQWRGLALRNGVVEAEAGPAGMMLHNAAVEVAASHVQAQGSLGWDGSLSNAHLDIHADDANAALLSLPERWRRMPRLFYGPGHFALAASGPANAVALQVLLDLNDLRAEGEGHLDRADGTASFTANLRHPSAPNLLEELGVAGADQWLDRGSLAVSARLAVADGLWRVEDLAASAGVARLYGTAELDVRGEVPRVRADLDAQTLALPAWLPHGATPVDLGWLAGWNVQAGVHAAQVLADLQPVAQNLQASVGFGGGVLAIEGAAAPIAGGEIAASAALDVGQEPPFLALRAEARQFVLPSALQAALPAVPATGVADGAAELTARGHSASAWLATLAGNAEVQLSTVVVPGMDLPQVATLLAARPARLRPLLTQALSAGSSVGFAGRLQANIAAGAVQIASTRLAGPAGSVEMRGVLDLAAGSGEVSYRVSPAGSVMAPLGVTLAGPWPNMRRSVDTAPALRVAKR